MDSFIEKSVKRSTFAIHFSAIILTLAYFHEVKRALVVQRIE